MQEVRTLREDHDRLQRSHATLQTQVDAVVQQHEALRMLAMQGRPPSGLPPFPAQNRMITPRPSSTATPFQPFALALTRSPQRSGAAAQHSNDTVNPRDLPSGVHYLSPSSAIWRTPSSPVRNTPGGPDSSSAFGPRSSPVIHRGATVPGDAYNGHSWAGSSLSSISNLTYDMALAYTMANVRGAEDQAQERDGADTDHEMDGDL